MKLLEGPKKGFILIDYFLLIFAVIGNCLVLGSLSKLRFSLTAYRQFLFSLLGSDLFVCGVNFMSFIYQAVSVYSTNNEFAKLGADIIRSLQITGFIANLLNLSGMSVDHYIGIINPLRYHQILSKRYVRIAVGLIWLTSFTIGFADFIVSMIMEFIANNELSEKQQFFINDTSHSFLELFGGGNLTNPNQTLSSLLLILKLFGHSDRSRSSSSSSTEMPPSDEFYVTSLPRFGRSSHEEQDSRESSLEIAGGGPAETMRQLEIILANILNATVNQTSPSGSSSESPFPFFDFPVFDMMNDTTASPFDLPPTSPFDPASIVAQIIEMKKKKKAMNYKPSSNKVWLEFTVMSLTIACFIFLTFCYGRIFREVSVTFGNTGTNTSRIVITTVLMLGSFTVCWLPFMTFELIMIYEIKTATLDLFQSTSFFAVHNAFNTLLMCSPLLDPIIYAWRMRVVRRYILVRYLAFMPCIRSYVDRVKYRNSFTSIGIAPGGSTNHINSTRPSGIYKEPVNRKNVLGGVYFDREGMLLRSHSDSLCLKKQRSAPNMNTENKDGFNNQRLIGNGYMFHSFDLSTICRYIDDPDDSDGDDEDGPDAICREIAAQQNRHHHSNGNFLTVPNQNDRALLLPIQRTASSPPSKVLDESVTSSKLSLPTTPLTPLYLRSGLQMNNFPDSEAVLSHFRVNSFNLLGAGAFGRNSVTLNCPTINH